MFSFLYSKWLRINSNKNPPRTQQIEFWSYCIHANIELHWTAWHEFYHKIIHTNIHIHFIVSIECRSRTLQMTLNEAVDLSLDNLFLTHISSFSHSFIHSLSHSLCKSKYESLQDFRYNSFFLCWWWWLNWIEVKLVFRRLERPNTAVKVNFILMIQWICRQTTPYKTLSIIDEIFANIYYTHSSMCLSYECTTNHLNARKVHTHSQLKVLPWVNKCSLTQPLCGRLLVRDFRAIFFSLVFCVSMYVVLLGFFAASCAFSSRSYGKKSYCKKQQTVTHKYVRWHWNILLFETHFFVVSCPCIGISMLRCMRAFLSNDTLS